METVKIDYRIDEAGRTLMRAYCKAMPRDYGITVTFGRLKNLYRVASACARLEYHDRERRGDWTSSRLQSHQIAEAMQYSINGLDYYTDPRNITPMGEDPTPGASSPWLAMRVLAIRDVLNGIWPHYYFDAGRMKDVANEFDRRARKGHG